MQTGLFYAFCLHGVSKSDILGIYSSDIDEKRDCLQVELSPMNRTNGYEQGGQ